MIFRLLAVLNEFERDQISERIRMALAHKKREGLVYGQISFGLRRDGDLLIPDQEEQKVLRMLRRWREKGWSLRKISEELNKRCIPAKKGGVWYPTGVASVLKD